MVFIRFFKKTFFFNFTISMLTLASRSFSTKAEIHQYFERIYEDVVAKRRGHLELLTEEEMLVIDHILTFDPSRSSFIPKHGHYLFVTHAVKGGARIAVLTKNHAPRFFQLRKAIDALPDPVPAYIPRIGFKNTPLRHQVFRLAIAHQKYALMNTVLRKNPYCEYTGERLTMQNATMHHVVPFIDILNGFLMQEGLTLEQVHYIFRGTKWVLADPALKYRWEQYHLHHARIMLATRDGHNALHFGIP